MVPYTLTILCVCVAGAIHWMSPKAYWKATLMSTAVILLFSVAALFIFQASGMLVSEQTGENADFSGQMLTITILVTFLGFLSPFSWAGFYASLETDISLLGCAIMVQPTFPNYAFLCYWIKLSFGLISKNPPSFPA